MVIVACAVAFAEEYLHALRHVDPHEVVEPADHGRDRRERDGLGDGVVLQVPLAEGSHLEVELHNEGTVETLLDPLSWSSRDAAERHSLRKCRG